MKIENNKITFEEKEYSKNLIVGPEITDIDFGDLLIFRGILDLSKSSLKKVNLGKLRWIENIINPYNIHIEGLEIVWSKYLKGNTPNLDWYKDREKPLIYLGGKIDGGLDENGNGIDSLLDLRMQQERELLSRNNLRVYNPGGVITYPDEGVLTFPSFPGELDLKMIDEADYLFYDLRQVSEGTRAEFGYSVGKGYHKTKKIFVLVNEIVTNCLTLALLKQGCIVVKDMNEILDKIEYAELLKKVRKINFSWWKSNLEYETKLNKEYTLNWKVPSEGYTSASSEELEKYTEMVEFKYTTKPNIYNMILAINCELLEYLESGDKKELADVFILSMLLYRDLLKDHSKFKDILVNKSADSSINLEPLTHDNLFDYLPQLIMWSSQVSDYILEKIAFNKIRQDHIKNA